jgi:hypothetical protein
MKTVTLQQSVSFWPDRIAPYSLTMQAGERLFVLLDEGEKMLLSISEEPTPGDSRWINRELVTL